jgi:nucleoside-diphosphate-sugar epimerase
VLKDNHDVRLPVRRAARISPALRPLGVSSDVEHIVGDATDAKTVEHALDGCEAVVHAVAVFNLVPPGRRGASI